MCSNGWTKGGLDENIVWKTKIYPSGWNEIRTCWNYCKKTKMCSCSWSNGGPVGGLTTALTAKTSVAKIKTVSVTSVLLPFPFPVQSKIILSLKFFITIYNKKSSEKSSLLGEKEIARDCKVFVSKVVFDRREEIARDCKVFVSKVVFARRKRDC